jgi:hypothetical protein
MMNDTDKQIEQWGYATVIAIFGVLLYFIVMATFCSCAQHDPVYATVVITMTDGDVVSHTYKVSGGTRGNIWSYGGYFHVDAIDGIRYTYREDKIESYKVTR